ncbi:hypothetical protein FPV67DRAFT_1508921 [Lyophyllum atratum]|nr:hypothetical protein FPV67DRAFT_1508921 [Lyophyllum atratum]
MFGARASRPLLTSWPFQGCHHRCAFKSEGRERNFKGKADRPRPRVGFRILDRAGFDLRNSSAFYSLKRAQLNQLCSAHGVKANGTNEALIARLQAKISQVPGAFWARSRPQCISICVCPSNGSRSWPSHDLSNNADSLGSHAQLLRQYGLSNISPAISVQAQPTPALVRRHRYNRVDVSVVGWPHLFGIGLVDQRRQASLPDGHIGANKQKQACPTSC